MKESDKFNRSNTHLSLISSREFFSEAVQDALVDLGLSKPPIVKNYLVQLLDQYLTTENLFPVQTTDETTPVRKQTLAELYLIACQTEAPLRRQRLREVADLSLYISGFFSASLKRKLVDVDYYAQIGGSAYHALAGDSDDAWSGRVFAEFAEYFLDYVDLLMAVSQKTHMHTNQDLLRLYDIYLATGSKYAERELQVQGLIAPVDLKKAGQQ